MIRLDDVFHRRLLTAHFQPIVDIEHGQIIGYEALARGPVGTALETPRALFQAAGEHRAVVQLEECCWMAALDSLSLQTINRAPGTRIFLNALPSTLIAPEFERGANATLSRLRIDPAQVVIEISEEMRVDDLAAFRSAISRYRVAGYGIAIDDAGAGHSGLHMMAEIVPDLLKIDANLVREVDRHIGRRATIDALIMLARTLGIEVIAEGIETLEELHTLQDLGVKLGQGYLLGRPDARIAPSIETRLPQRAARTPTLAPFAELAADGIGRLVTSTATVESGTELSAAMGLFEVQHVDAVVVVKSHRPMGLLMKAQLYQTLGRQYGRELHLRRPVDGVASMRPLVVEHTAPLAEVSRLAMAREPRCLYDHIIVVREGIVVGIVSVQRLLAAITDWRVDAARNANPLTGLPGNAIIERELRTRIRANGRVALMHIDLDDFKAFNDSYGFHRGDTAITMTAEILRAEFSMAAPQAHFLGHIGGDDFLAIVNADVAAGIVDRLPRTFTNRMAELYDAEDRVRGWLIAPDRSEEHEAVPLMSLSVAVAYVEPNDERHYAELLDALSAAKREAKLAKRERRRLQHRIGA